EKSCADPTRTIEAPWLPKSCTVTAPVASDSVSAIEQQCAPPVQSQSTAVGCPPPSSASSSTEPGPPNETHPKSPHCRGRGSVRSIRRTPCADAVRWRSRYFEIPPWLCERPYVSVTVHALRCPDSVLVTRRSAPAVPEASTSATSAAEAASGRRVIRCRMPPRASSLPRAPPPLD